jgi:hypothetical protein
MVNRRMPWQRQVKTTIEMMILQELVGLERAYQRKLLLYRRHHHKPTMLGVLSYHWPR